MVEILLTRVIVQTKVTLPLNLLLGLSVLTIAFLLGVALIPKKQRKSNNISTRNYKTCKYYSGSHILKCAVNPHLPCSECKDYDSI
jgi:hypothetical protein